MKGQSDIEGAPLASNAKAKVIKRWYKGPPFLTSFHSFPKLPTEVRIMIWQLSVNPRVVEIEFSESRGFYTRVATPLSLRVNQDSRNAVLLLYPTCFGNPLYESRIVFNFELDTLLLPAHIQFHTHHLFATFKPQEWARLQYLAVAADINEDWSEYGQGEPCLQPPVCVLEKAVKSLTSLKELLIVFDVVRYLENGLHHVPEGNGPMQLTGWLLPDDVSEFHDVWCEVRDELLFAHLDECKICRDEDESGSLFPAHTMEVCDCEHGIPPTMPDQFDIIKSIELEPSWGWRPTKEMY